jgi:hypothetical protein
LECAPAFQLTQQFSEGTFDRFKQLKLELNFKFAQCDSCNPSIQLQLLQRPTYVLVLGLTEKNMAKLLQNSALKYGS